jgi:hypothetical protein
MHLDFGISDRIPITDVPRVIRKNSNRILRKIPISQAIMKEVESTVSLICIKSLSWGYLVLSQTSPKSTFSSNYFCIKQLFTLHCGHIEYLLPSTLKMEHLGTHACINLKVGTLKNYWGERDPRWWLGCRSRQSELHDSKTLLRCWSHTWRK